MAIYEVLQIKTLPTHVALLAQDYAFFGWIRIRKEEFKELELNPEQKEQEQVEESVETVKTNQAIYPDSASFSDFGDNNMLSQPSPNDSATYDGYQSLYFKRDVALPHKEELDALKAKYDEIKKECNAKEDEISHRKVVGHFSLWFWRFALDRRLFVLMAGFVMLVLSLVKPEDFASLKESGIGLSIGGGFMFLLGFSLILLSFFKGMTKKNEKAIRKELLVYQSQKAEILTQAASLLPTNKAKTFNVRFEVA